eukprot:TRINITY_DN33957_c0_g1_i1.p1 TRINITY_DN33957_c0_g1~~TRINITY_DN33957_c0_g1_i1.p1  ORF type:complete len:822 (+),score=215.74 TRINITY_DN33957_c0_g1_i1:81-2468(+)
MALGQPELRMDGAEGPFTKAEFIEFYGDAAEWDRAIPYSLYCACYGAPAGAAAPAASEPGEEVAPPAPSAAGSTVTLYERCIPDPADGYCAYVAARESAHDAGDDDDTPWAYLGPCCPRPLPGDSGRGGAGQRGMFAGAHMQAGEVAVVAEAVDLPREWSRARQAAELERRRDPALTDLWPRSLADAGSELLAAEAADGGPGEGEQMRLRLALRCNSHNSGLYPAAAPFNHSCRPNCYTTLTPGGRLCVRTRRAVSPGEELTICYLGLDGGVPRCPAPARRGELRRRFGFDCRCPECAGSGTGSRPTGAEAAGLLGQRDAAYAELTDSGDRAAAVRLWAACERLADFHEAQGRPQDPEVAAAALDAAGAAAALEDSAGETRWLRRCSAVLALHESRRCAACGRWGWRTARCRQCLTDWCADSTCAAQTPCGCAAPRPPDPAAAAASALRVTGLGAAAAAGWFASVSGRPADEPWETGVPQPAVVDAARRGLLQGKILDCGCGGGANALFLAGCAGVSCVVGFDAVPATVAAAERRLLGRGVLHAGCAALTRRRLRLARRGAVPAGTPVEVLRVPATQQDAACCGSRRSAGAARVAVNGVECDCDWDDVAPVTESAGYPSALYGGRGGSADLAEEGMPLVGAQRPAGGGYPGSLYRRASAGPPLSGCGRPRFYVADALSCGSDHSLLREAPYDASLDSALMHCFAPRERQQYLGELRRLLRPGGVLVLLCLDVSYPIPPEAAPVRYSEGDLRLLFAPGTGWELRDLARCRFRHTDLAEPGRAEKHAWRAVLVRDDS